MNLLHVIISGPCFRRLLAVAALWIGINGCLLHAQPAVGTIEGRVLNSDTATYLETVRINIEGTSFEAFSNVDGYYVLVNVPAGRVKIRAFYTGLLPKTEEVLVAAGETVQHNISLSTSLKKTGLGTEEAPIKLDEFVVAASREMSGAAIAINVQRFSPNIVNVASIDEFGGGTEGNVAEFLKYIPGVSVESIVGVNRRVSIDGMPSDNTPITVDGFSLASAISGAFGADSTKRTVQVDTIPINNLSRVEVQFSPTPESPGMALAGSINMLPRSAFEITRPVLKTSAYVIMPDNERSFSKTPGPLDQPTRKPNAGFNFSYTAPINKRFGFTLSGATGGQYFAWPFSQMTWRGGGAATNGTTFPHTTPDQPYLSKYMMRDGSMETQRTSFGLTLDFRLTQYDRFSLGFQFSNVSEKSSLHQLEFNVNKVLPGDFSIASTHGAVGAGDIRSSIEDQREGINRSYMPSLTWRHDGPVWKAVAGVGFSGAVLRYRDIDQGNFDETVAIRTGVTVSFDDIFYLRPNRITVTDGSTGEPVDPYSLSSYALSHAFADQNDTAVTQRTLYANLSRDFSWRVPVTLKGGLDFRRSTHDIRHMFDRYNYVGADGVGSTTPIGGDDSPLPFLSASASQRGAPFGFPKIEWVSNQQLWDTYQAHPGYFTRNANTDYKNEVAASKSAEELISSAYLRGDVQFFERRLKLIGGVRVEQTNVKAQGLLNDPTLNFQRDASGQIILTNGKPQLIVPTSDAFGVSQLTLIDRGTKVEKEYLRFFPSLNASFNIRDNLIARVALYNSIGRPDFNQYTGGVTLPNTTQSSTGVNRMKVNNAAIKPWSAKSTVVRLEYYFQGVGQISLGAFQRDLTNAFGGTVFDATPEFLALYNLDPEVYGDYEVSTQENLQGTLRVEGLNFSYKQALTFLPHWARGVQVFVNGSSQRVTGDNVEEFTGMFITPRSGSWGVSLTREKFNLRMNWNFRGRQRRNLINASTSIDPGTFRWDSQLLKIDILGEYHLNKRFTLFANLSDVRAQPVDIERAGPRTPPVAQFNVRREYPSFWTFGVKGTF